ncbi:hypothetical protein REPUB_Repub13aG0047600 [Reevesia pubescens]
MIVQKMKFHNSPRIKASAQSFELELGQKLIIGSFDGKKTGKKRRPDQGVIVGGGPMEKTCKKSLKESLKVTRSRQRFSKTSLYRNSFLPSKSKPSDVSKLDCRGKSSEIRKSNSDFGAVTALHDKNVDLTSQVITPAATDALTRIVDMQMSPKKALRAAMLKTRFADTIFKAQTILLFHGDRADPVKIQQEKEKLETRLREEKAKVEAHIRAAEAVAKMKAEVGLKRKRERERESDRIALEKMENTAGIELNLEIVKELDVLSGCSLSRGNPLHQLGLFIKEEYLKDDNDEAILNEDLEETLKAEVGLKRKREREREREAARIALEKMENTAGIELNSEIVKELDILSGWSLSRGNPLHQLGLFIKEEYLEDDNDHNEDLEEGKILP